MDHSDDDVSNSPDKRRVIPPIRVVNLANLQTIKVVRNDVPPRPNRRKSVHQPRSSSDDPVEFIESPIESNDETSGSNSTMASSSSNIVTPVRKLQRTHSNLRRTMDKQVSTDKKRPNANLMKKVALLRVCAEYMLNILHIKNVDFGENQSLEMLKAQYLRSLEQKRAH